MYTCGYNFGRIASYALFGFIFGSIGDLTIHLLPLRVAQTILRALSGFAMVGIGLHLLGVTKWWRVVENCGAPIWRKLQPLVRSRLPLRSLADCIAVGALWGWIPCGMVYSALALAASAGSATAGASDMFAFGLGTLPALAVAGSIAARTATMRFVPAFRPIAGVAIVVLGLFTSVKSSADTIAKLRGDKSSTECHSQSHVRHDVHDVAP